MEVETHTSGENFMHTALWEVAKRQIRHGKNSKKGAMLDDLAAMVFAMHAFEAYLNFVGSRLDPVFWEKERQHFRRGGFAARVGKVFELCGIPEPDATTRPYKTIGELRDLRDMIAHGHVQAFSEVVRHSADEEVPMLKNPFDDVVSADKAGQALEDVEAVATLLHAAAKPKTTYIWFGTGPFENVHGYASHSTQAVQP